MDLYEDCPTLSEELVALQGLIKLEGRVLMAHGTVEEALKHILDLKHIFETHLFEVKTDLKAIQHLAAAHQVATSSNCK